MAADRRAAHGPHRGRVRTRAALGWAVVAPACVIGLSAIPSAAPASYTLAPTGSAASTSYEPPGGVGGTVRPVVAPPLPTPTSAPEPVPAAPVEWRPAAFTLDLPDDRAAVAVAAAMAQIGLPYVWGGDGPTAGDAGFDCSGLTTFAYAAAGVALPRTAHTQYYAGPHVPSGAPLQPGDLVFYGVPARVHHVGMYIGDGRMVNAPTFGKPVQTAYYRWPGDDYLGATRPAATGQPTSGLLPYAPPADPPDAADRSVFVAPPAPLPVTPLPAPTDPQPPEPETAAATLAAAPPAVTTTGPPSGVLPGRPTSSPAALGFTTTAPPSSTTTAPPSSTTTAPPDPTSPVPKQPTTAPSATSGDKAPPEPTSTPVPQPASAPAASTPEVTTSSEAAGPSVTVAGTRTALSGTRAGADGLPRATGIWARPGTPVVRLASLARVEVGSSVSLAGPGGSSTDFTVRSRAAATTEEAATIIAGSPPGQLVLIAPAGEGAWTVVTAR